MAYTGVFACGAECGQLGSVGQHWSTATGLTVDTGTVRTGSRSLKFALSGSAGQSTCVLAAATFTVARFYVRFSTLPSANTYIAYTGGTATDRIGIAFKQSDSKLYCASGTTISFAGTGQAITTGQWYRLDVKLDQTSGAKKCDAQLDGVALSQSTNTGAGAAAQFTIGSTALVTTTSFYDDFVISNTSGDYPIGAGFVAHFVPTSDGAHSTGTAGNFITGAAGANITDATTDSYLLVDDTPLDDTAPDTNDYIALHNDTGATSNYVEHVFGPASGVGAPTDAPRAVEVIAAHHQAGTGTGDCIFKLNDNGTEDAYLTRSAVAGVTTIKYARKHYATAPTGGAWNINGSGNAAFNNLRHRFGYSNDANPDQYFDCVMIEAEFPPFTGYTLTATDNAMTMTGQSAGLAYGKKLTATDQAMTLTAQSVNFVYGKKVTANPGALVLTGQSAVLTSSANPTLAVTNGTLTLTGQAANLIFGRKLTANPGTIVFSGQSAALSEASHLVVNPGTLTLTGQTATLRFGRKLTASPGSLVLTGTSDFDLFWNQSEEFALNFIIELLPAEAANDQEYAARITIDTVEQKIIDFSYREEAQALTGKLDLRMLDVDNRLILSRDSEVKFEIGTTSSGITSYETLFDTGNLEKTDYHIQRQGNGPGDTFTITTKPTMLVRLEKTPTHGIVLYDPLKHEIDPNDWPIIKDTRANSYTPTFTSLNHLKLYTILDAAFVTGCGFGAVHTNIPNYEVGIVEFRTGQTYMNSVAGIIGCYEPVFSQVGDDLWIHDGTSGLPAGMPTPRQVTCSDLRSIGQAVDHQRVNAILLTYIADLRPYDFFTDRTETSTDTNGTGTGVVTIETVTHYRDYFRNTNPDVPVREEIFRKDTTVSTYVLELDIFWDLEVIETATELFTYSGLGDLILRTKTTQKRLPNPDNSYSIEMIDYEDERETFLYTQHPFKPMRRYCKFRQSITTAPIVTDTDNQQLGVNYSQELLKVYESGNVTDVMTATRGPVYSLTEYGTPLRSGRVRFHIHEIDHAVGCSIKNYEEERDGELGITSLVKEPRQVYVLQTDSAVRNTDRIEELNAGEAPPTNVGIPLARRVLLQRNTYPARVAVDLIGIDLTLQKGTAVNVLGRDNADLGNYIVEARTISGSRDEYFTTLELRQAS